MPTVNTIAPKPQEPIAKAKPASAAGERGIRATVKLTQHHGETGLLTKVNLPADTWQVKDLPNQLASALGYAFSPAVTDFCRATSARVTLQPNTEVRVMVAPMDPHLAPITGTRVGLFGRLVHAVMTVITAIWAGISTLFGLRREAALKTGSQTSDLPVMVHATTNQTIRGTLGGVPGWLVRQDVDGMIYDPVAGGEIIGNVKLLNLFSLPPLTSSFYPPWIRLVLPALDLRPEALLLQGMEFLPQSGQSVAALRDHTGSLVLVKEARKDILPLMEGNALKVTMPHFNIDVGADGVAAQSTVMAQVGEIGRYHNTLKVGMQLFAGANLLEAAPSVAAPYAMAARADIAFGQGPSGAVTSQYTAEVSLHTDGAHALMNMRVAAHQPKVFGTPVAAVPTATGFTGPSLTELAEQIAGRTVNWWEDLPDASLMVGNQGHSMFAQLKQRKAQYLAGAASTLPSAVEPVVQNGASDATTPVTDDDTPSLTSASSDTLSRSPSLVTLADDDAHRDNGADQRTLKG